MIKKMRTFLIAAACAQIVVSCSDNPNTANLTSVINVATLDTLYASFKNLPTLEADYAYEVWLNYRGSYVSVAKFLYPRSSGESLPYSKDIDSAFYVSRDTLANAFSFLLSIEPALDGDPGVSKTKLLGGYFKNNESLSSMNYIDAFGLNFTESLQKNTNIVYTILTPTDGDTIRNESSGIWFFYEENGERKNRLSKLPSLPSGWKYETWLVKKEGIVGGAHNGYALSMGKFTDPNADDEANLYIDNVAPAPAFPGEDFLMRAPQGFTFPYAIGKDDAIVLSIEPSPDDDPSIFALRPFADTSFSSNVPPIHAPIYTMKYMLGTNEPKATLSIK